MTTGSSVRRKALRRGFVIRKSRQRKHVPNIDNFGDYMLIEANRNLVALGSSFDATLEDIESFLNDGEEAV
jgi:hypothetical protein